MSVYGNRYFSVIFIPLITINEDGFVYKQKVYKWSDIEEIKVSQENPLFSEDLPGVLLFSKASIALRGGGLLTIKGESLEKKNETLRAGFLSAFDELIATLTIERKNSLKEPDRTVDTDS